MARPEMLCKLYRQDEVDFKQQVAPKLIERLLPSSEKDMIIWPVLLLLKKINKNFCCSKL